jgi:hypothetical protein
VNIRYFMMVSLVVTSTAQAQDLTVLPTIAITPSTELVRRTDRVAEVFRSRGATVLRERWSTFLREENSSAFSVSLERGRCVGFVAVGRELFRDLDLHVSNDEGTEIARDDRRDAHPYVRVCPTGATTLHLRVRAASGNGEVTVLTLADPPLLAPPLDDILGVRPTHLFTGPRIARAEVGVDPAAPNAAQLIEHVAEQWVARSYQRLNIMRSGHLGQGQSTRVQISLVRDHCYAVQAMGGDHVDDLDLRVFSPLGRFLVQDAGLDARPSMRFCAAVSGEHPVDVRMYSGSGEFHLEVFEIPEMSNRLGGDVVGVERARALDVASEAARRSLRPWLDAQRGTSWTSSVTGFPVDFRAGRCYMFGTAGNEQLAALDTWIAGPDGAVLASDTNERERALVFYCARRDLRGTVYVRTHGGRGEYVLQSFEGGETVP